MTVSTEWSLLTTEQIKTIEKFQKEFPVAIGNIAKAFGLVVKKSTLPAGISGEIKEENGSYVIRVNRHDVKARQRFTISHEIAHFLLHKDKIGDGITDDVLYRSKLSDLLEIQANRLAADMILPWKLIKDSLQKHAEKKTETKYEIIAEEAEVSTTALKIRLGKL